MPLVSFSPVIEVKLTIEPAKPVAGPKGRLHDLFCNPGRQQTVN